MGQSLCQLRSCWPGSGSPGLRQVDGRVTGSIEAGAAETAFGERRRAILALLGFDGEENSVVQGRYGSDLVPLVHRLLELPDPVVMEVLALVMAETLDVGSEVIEILGLTLKVDIARYWQADQAFFDCLRDREVMTAILGEVGGAAVASANAKEKGKVIKSVIADYARSLARGAARSLSVLAASTCRPNSTRHARLLNRPKSTHGPGGAGWAAKCDQKGGGSGQAHPQGCNSV